MDLSINANSAIYELIIISILWDTTT